jgi:hypothetical protein
MPKVSASFDDQQHADAVVSELGRMNIDGLDWRVHQPGDRSTGAVPVVGVPANTGGSGVGAAGGGTAGVAPFFGAGADDLDAGSDDEDDYLRQARNRGATVIVVDAPSGTEDAIEDLLNRHNASNVTVT